MSQSNEKSIDSNHSQHHLDEHTHEEHEKHGETHREEEKDQLNKNEWEKMTIKKMKELINEKILVVQPDFSEQMIAGQED